MPCWRSFPQSLARIRQERPDITDELAWRELHVEINNALWGMSEGVPIDKFRYPRLGKMVDLVVLVRNKYLAYENIQWQKVECNLKWLEQRWPVPAHAMEPEESQPLNKSDLVDALKPATQADAGAGADAKPAAVELLGALNPDAKSEPTPPTELEPSSSELAAQKPQLVKLQPEKSQTEEREPKKQWKAKDARPWLVQRLVDDPPKGNWAKWARDTYAEMREDFKNELPWSDWSTLRRRMSDPDIWKEVEEKSSKKN